MRGLASQDPTEWCISVACSTVFHGTFVLFPVGPLSHGTPKHDSGGKVLQQHSRTGARNQQGKRAMHPLAQAEGLSGPFL